MARDFLGFRWQVDFSWQLDFQLVHHPVFCFVAEMPPLAFIVLSPKKAVKRFSINLGFCPSFHEVTYLLKLYKDDEEEAEEEDEAEEEEDDDDDEDEEEDDDDDDEEEEDDGIQ